MAGVLQAAVEARAPRSLPGAGGESYRVRAGYARKGLAAVGRHRVQVGAHATAT